MGSAALNAIATSGAGRVKVPVSGGDSIGPTRRDPTQTPVQPQVVTSTAGVPVVQTATQREWEQFGILLFCLLAVGVVLWLGWAVTKPEPVAKAPCRR
jgi:hypothetical protein